MPIINTGFIGGGQGGNLPILFQVELQPYSTNWTNYSSIDSVLSSQIIENPNLLKDGYCYLVSPSQKDYNIYINSGIRALDITTDGKIEFICLSGNKIPDTPITVDILRIEEEDV